MNDIPAALAAHLLTRNTTIATALKVTRTDGEIFAFTTHDINDEIDGLLYLGNPGLLTTDMVISSGAAVGNLELRTLNDETIFTTVDILNGKWRNAEFLIFRYNYQQVAASSPPVADVHKLLAGTLGEATIQQNDLVVELRDLRQYLQQPVGDASSKTCRARLGDLRCGVRTDPPAWTPGAPVTVRPAGDARLGGVVKPTVLNNRHFKCTTTGTTGATEPSWNTTLGGTTSDGSAVWTAIRALTVRGSITSVSGLLPRQVFADGARPEPSNFFDEGEFRVLSGDNAGSSRAIKSFTIGGSFVLKLPYAAPLQAGDTYEAVAGCRKRHDRQTEFPSGASDCIDSFDNILNYQGEPHRRGLNNLTSAPSQDVSG